MKFTPLLGTIGCTKMTPKVYRIEAPWFFFFFNSYNAPPWCNSNYGHYMEGEAMRVVNEKTFVPNKVDAVFLSF